MAKPVNSTATEAQPLEWGIWESLGMVSFVIVWFVLAGWIFWHMFRAYRSVPKELEGIRIALERIADQLEKKG